MIKYHSSSIHFLVKSWDPLDSQISNIKHHISMNFLRSSGKMFKETILHSLKSVEELSPATCPRWNSARHRLLKWLAAGEGNSVVVYDNGTPRKADDDATKKWKKTCHQQIITCNHVKKADFKIIVSLFKSTNILSCTWNLEVPWSIRDRYF